MSQPPPAPIAPPGGRATLWLAPWWVTGPQLRQAVSAKLPGWQRTAVFVPFAVLVSVLAAVSIDADQPVVLAAGWALGFVALVVTMRALQIRRRLSFGLVRATARQFDLAVAVVRLPTGSIDSGRQLHDHLVWLLQQPVRDEAALRNCELRMEQLAHAPH